MKHKKIGSIKTELIDKAKEAMLSAVQIFNNPNIYFKSETFIVLSIIAWTYLLHAYYRDKRIEYRYYEQKGKRRFFHKTKHGAFKHWELERCLNENQNPLDPATIANLKFLIGLRHEIEHQMTTRIDDYLSAKFQACCINFHHYLRKLFKKEVFGTNLSFSLQFSALSSEQISIMNNSQNMPNNITTYLASFEDTMTSEDYNNTAFAYRVIFVPKTVNRKGQADSVIEFISADSEMAKGLNKQYVVVKDREKNKYLPTDICKKMNELGYKKFNMHHHTELWKSVEAKKSEKNFGVQVVKTWYWYESWLNFVKEFCAKNKSIYS